MRHYNPHSINIIINIAIKIIVNIAKILQITIFCGFYIFFELKKNFNFFKQKCRNVWFLHHFGSVDCSDDCNID